MSDLEQKYELLKAQAVTDAAEIERLKSIIESLKNRIEVWADNETDNDYDDGFVTCSKSVLTEIKKLGG